MNHFRRNTDAPRRRRSGDLLLEAVNGLREMLAEEHQQSRKDLMDLSAKVDVLGVRVDRIVGGFPGGDPESHRRYHESIIEWREIRNRMVREALIKASGASAFVALGWICYALWVAFKMEVTK